MSAGHRHDGERAASALADEYYADAAKLVAACTVDGSFDVPWLANRSRDLKTVYRDRRVPRFLKCGIDTDLSLPWHELPEGEAMDDGLPYDTGTPSSHCDVATPLERREVERQKPDDPDIWAKYTDEMNGYIRAVDDESIERVPADIDLRPFAEDDRTLLEEIIAAQAAEENAARSSMQRLAMPQLLQPSDVAKRLKAGEKLQHIFFDAAGARVAKMIGVEASAVAGEADRSVDFAISTGSLDRYNSTIAVKGWQLANFNKNSVVLWAHDDSIPAIARAESTRVDGDRLRSSAVFADRDTHPLADTIYRLIKAKFIGAASVGWIPLKWQFVDEEGRGFGIDYLEQELLEWSVVNIPANPECLVEARSVGIDTSPLMVWATRALDLGGMSVIPRTELEALRKAAGAPEVYQLPQFLASRQRQTQRSDEAADWKVGAARDLPIEDDDSWDGPAAEAAIFSAYGFDGDKPDTAKAREAFLAYDASAPEKRGSYKLPFAKLVDGKLKASAAGIRAAASRLPDTDIPQSVKDAGRKVLDGYEEKMGKKDDAFDASAAALKTLFANGVLSLEEFCARMTALAKGIFTRAGRVLSKENEDRLRAAHDHCVAARDHVNHVIEQNKKKPDDGDDQGDGDQGGDDQDPEQNATAAAAAAAAPPAAEKQRQLARVLRLRGGAAA